MEKQTTEKFEVERKEKEMHFPREFVCVCLYVTAY